MLRGPWSLVFLQSLFYCRTVNYRESDSPRPWALMENFFRGIAHVDLAALTDAQNLFRDRIGVTSVVKLNLQVDKLLLGCSIGECLRFRSLFLDLICRYWSDDF